MSPEHLVTRARERFELQDYYGAIHLLDEVLASGRAFADAEHLLGVCYGLIGQPERALEHFDRALQLNPDYVEALIHRGLVLNELGREGEAEVALRRAGQVSAGGQHGLPTHFAAKLANLHASLADAYVEAGSPIEAIEQLRRSLSLGPSFHDLRHKLGRLLLETGRPLDAREQFETIVRARPTHLDAAAMLGLACYLSGDGLAARDVWRACRERRPEDPRVEAYLAMLERGDAVTVDAGAAAAS